LKSAVVSIAKFSARWYGYGVLLGSFTPMFDYWATRPLSMGQSFECAGLQVPESWQALLGNVIPSGDESYDVSSVTSRANGGYRCVVTRNGKLQFAFFASETPVQASRQWLQQLLGTDVIAAEVLAGRPVAATADIGPIVCACNGIGRLQISAAVSHMAGATLNAICDATRAGTGCGSCRPEIQKIINEMPRFLEAAE
jgi:assimilatory nitrate reductase catalytic subunit